MYVFDGIWPGKKKHKKAHHINIYYCTKCFQAIAEKKNLYTASSAIDVRSFNENGKINK